MRSIFLMEEPSCFGEEGRGDVFPIAPDNVSLPRIFDVIFHEHV
jgi:hypothetical protein